MRLRMVKMSASPRDDHTEKESRMNEWTRIDKELPKPECLLWAVDMDGYRKPFPAVYTKAGMFDSGFKNLDTGRYHWPTHWQYIRIPALPEGVEG